MELAKLRKTNTTLKKKNEWHTWCWWLTSVILATWEAEIGRIELQGQPRQIVHKVPSPK
jgi:hypothetical protein